MGQLIAYWWLRFAAAAENMVARDMKEIRRRLSFDISTSLRRTTCAHKIPMLMAQITWHLHLRPFSFHYKCHHKFTLHYHYATQNKNAKTHRQNRHAISFDIFISRDDDIIIIDTVYMLYDEATAFEIAPHLRCNIIFIAKSNFSDDCFGICRRWDGLFCYVIFIFIDALIASLLLADRQIQYRDIGAMRWLLFILSALCLYQTLRAILCVTRRLLRDWCRRFTIYYRFTPPSI